MCAFDLPGAGERNACVKRCFAEGLFVLGGGGYGYSRWRA